MPNWAQEKFRTLLTLFYGEKWNELISHEVEAGQTVNITALTPDGGGDIKFGHTLLQNGVFL